MRSFWSKCKNEKKQKTNVIKYVLDSYSKLYTRLSGKSFKFWLEVLSRTEMSMSISSHRVEKLGSYGMKSNCGLKGVNERRTATRHLHRPCCSSLFYFFSLTFRGIKRNRQLYFISRTGAVIDYTIQWHISYRIRLCKGWKKEWQSMKTI